MLEWFTLFLSIFDFILVLLVFKLFKIVTDNQEAILIALNEDIQRLRDDGK